MKFKNSDKTALNYLLQLVCCVVSVFFITEVQATTLYSDDFESGFNWTTSDGNLGGVSTQTSNSPSNSMYTRGGVVTVTSPVVDTSASTSLYLSVWIRKGSDVFSENPENGDNLEFGYMDSSNSFVVLETFVGGGTQGEIFTRSYDLTGTSAVHANFQVRARQTNGSGGPPANGGIGWDYWHIDDVVVFELSSPFAEWRMDEDSWSGTASEVVDQTGNGYSGTAVNGATTAVTSPAIATDPGTCGYGTFDDAGGGIGDYVELTSLPNQSTDFTITSWIRTNDNTRAGQRIFADDESNTGGYALSVGDGGTGTLRFFSRNVTNIILDTGNVISSNTWYFVAAVADITNSQRQLYIYDTSGTLVGSASDTFTGTWGTDAGVASIGGETNSGETGNRFFGDIDEVRFYDSALTQAEVEAIRDQTHDCPLPAATAEWRMDESAWTGTAGEAVDESGNGYDGTAVNGATTDSTSPVVSTNPGTCGYGTFDGTDDYVDVTNLSSILNGTASLTFWINTTQTGNDAAWQAPGVTGVEQAGGSDDIFWGWIDASGNIGISVGNDFTSKSSTAINDGGWHHVVLTRNATSGAYSIYIDGSLNASGTLATGTIGNAFTSIGRIEDTGGTPVYFNGQLDEVRVYSSVLSSAQAVTVMNETHPCSSLPIAYYRMDETWTVPASDTVIDYSGNLNHGDAILSGTGTQISNDSTSPAIAGSPGTCGFGLFPVNNNDANQHAVDSKLVPGDSGAVTFWYRSDIDWNIGSGSGTVKLLDATNSATSRFFLQKNGNNGRLIFRMDDGAGNQAQVITPNQTFVANEWVHIAITWDLPNNQLEIYINGTLSNTGTSTGTTAATWNSLYIGDNRAVGVTGDGTGRSAYGAIDEVRIYPDTIDSARVNTDFTSTHPCTLIDHYQINVVSGSPSVCEPITIEITAHDVTNGAINVDAATVLNFSTNSGTGIWTSLLTGSGTWSPSGNNDGIASYTWPGGESSLQVTFSQPSAVTENIDLDDGAATDLSGDVFEDPDINFNSAPIIRITTDGTDQGSIDTEIAGKNSNVAPAQTLYVQLKQSGITFFGQDACEVPQPYSGNVTVQIAAECIDPASCAGNQVSINGAAVNTYDSGSVPASSASWTGVNMNFDAGATYTATDDNKALFYFNYPDAGSMKLYFEIQNFNPSGFGTPNLDFSGESNIFVVRPFGFYIDDFKVETVSKANPVATDSTGGIFAKAGQSFSVDVSAVVWEAADDDGSSGGTANDGIPDLNSDLSGNATTPNFGNESTAATADITHTLVAPVNASAQQGTLSGSGNVSGFASGILNDQTMSWDEVGIIQLDVTMLNNDYLSGDEDVIGQILYLGRFTPANLTVQVVGSAQFDNSCSTGGFTYLDQTFYYGPNANDAPRLRVRGVDVNGNITYNYDSGTGANGFWKLNSTTLPRVYTDAAGAAALFNSPILDTDVNYLNMGNYNGQVILRLDRGTVGDMFLYQRVSEEAPFNASADLTFTGDGLVDDDGICYDADSDGNCGEIPDDNFTYGNITGTGAMSQRFGRLNIGTAVGSELLPISVTFQTEYYNGTGFILNTDDDCTAIAASDLSLTSAIASGSGPTIDITDSCGGTGVATATMANNPLVGGLGDLSFALASPAEGCKGYADITLDLTTLIIDYLQYDWLAEDGTYDDDPKGRIDFGLFEGPKQYIYIREPW